MAFHILSRLSTSTGAVLSWPKAQSFCRFSSSSDAKCVFCKWTANPKSFCNKRGEVINSGLLKRKSLSGFCSASDASSVLSRCSVFSRCAANAKSFFNKLGGIKNSGMDEEVPIVQEKRVDVLNLCNCKRVEDITYFPPEVLASNELLFELFELWMVEFKKSYPSEEEKIDRFEVFKGRLAKIVWYNKWYKTAVEVNGGSTENICQFTPHYHLDRRVVEGPWSLHPYYQRRLEEDNKLIMKMKKAVKLLA